MSAYHITILIFYYYNFKVSSEYIVKTTVEKVKTELLDYDIDQL